jgi:hypothetical protein
MDSVVAGAGHEGLRGNSYCVQWPGHIIWVRYVLFDGSVKLSHIMSTVGECLWLIMDYDTDSEYESTWTKTCLHY